MDREHRGIGRKGRIVLVTFLIVIVLMIGLVIFVNRFFRIETINITGSDKYSYEQIYKYVFENRNDKNLILFKITDRRAPAIEIPFIAKTVIETKGTNTINITVYEKSLVFYIEYKGTYMYIDKDGIVSESSGEIIDGIMRVNGLNYSSIVVHDKINVGDDHIFADITDIIQFLTKNEVQADSVDVAATGYSLMIGDVRVLLGENDTSMADKINELSCMLSELEGLSGTLHLENFEAGSNNIVFKKD